MPRQSRASSEHMEPPSKLRRRSAAVQPGLDRVEGSAVWRQICTQLLFEVIHGLEQSFTAKLHPLIHPQALAQLVACLVGLPLLLIRFVEVRACGEGGVGGTKPGLVRRLGMSTSKP